MFLATFQLLVIAINVVTADTEAKTDKTQAISGSDIKGVLKFLILTLFLNICLRPSKEYFCFRRKPELPSKPHCIQRAENGFSLVRLFILRRQLDDGGPLNCI